MCLICLCYNDEQMKPLRKAGFTIVETMLFLGISGLLVMGVLVGTGTSINIQRYRDSVTSLKSFLQQQYSEVSNVNNSSTGNACYGDGSTNNPRGQSDCVILGRYIISTDGKNLVVKGVIGYIPPDVVLGSNDVEALKKYNIQISPQPSETYEIEWGSTLAHKNGDTMAFSMLILRSPTSGVIRTFIDNSQAISDSNIANLLSIAPSALENDATICVDSNGLFTGTKLAVYIEKNTTSASGIETLGDNNGCQ